MDKALKAVFDTHKATDVVYCVGGSYFVTELTARNHAQVTRQEIETFKREDMEEAKPKRTRKKKTENND